MNQSVCDARAPTRAQAIVHVIEYYIRLDIT